MSDSAAETVIIGGGPAGAAAAIELARAGASVTLIERMAGPHDKVCGDFLGGPALAALAKLGIDPAGLGAAPIERVRLIAGERMAEAPLPFPASGLSRRVLDEALLGRAVDAGATVRRGESVPGLGTGRLARTVLLATGKHDLRGVNRPSHGRGAVGLKLYLSLRPDQARALAGAVEVVLLPDGYAGLQMVEGGRAVLCVMRPRAGDPHRLLDTLAAASPHLRRRLLGATPSGDRVLAIAGVPYGHLHHASSDDKPWLFRLGDQAAVIPSLAGEGIAIALGSGGMAARSILAGTDSTIYYHELLNRLRQPMWLAMSVHRLAAVPILHPLMVSGCCFFPSIIGFTATRTRC